MGAGGVGGFDPWSWHEEAGGEVVADGFGSAVVGLADAVGVEAVDVGVVDDVFEFVGEAEALAEGVVVGVELNVPGASGPGGLA